MHFSEWVITTLSYIMSPGKRNFINRSKLFRAQKGLEIGGPSAIFKLKGAFPIYLYAQQVDGVNFSHSTIWEGDILQEDDYAYYHNKKGTQFIAEGVDLSFIKDNSYDFLLSCHSLEHIANPLKALKEWNRVLKANGSLVLILPNKVFTFDRNRPITTMDHLLKDFHNNTSEQDKTHFEEIIALHDLSMDSVGSKDALVQRTDQNDAIRAVHHHVFDFNLIQAMLKEAGFKVTLQQTYPPFHLITVAVKVGDTQ